MRMGRQADVDPNNYDNSLYKEKQKNIDLTKLKLRYLKKRQNWCRTFRLSYSMAHETIYSMDNDPMRNNVRNIDLHVWLWNWNVWRIW